MTVPQQMQHVETSQGGYSMYPTAVLLAALKALNRLWQSKCLLSPESLNIAMRMLNTV